MELTMTCSACPEQYDLVDDDRERIAYFRLRHGYFAVVVPDVGGDQVYGSETIGDGLFDGSERADHLFKGLVAVAARYGRFDIFMFAKEWLDANAEPGFAAIMTELRALRAQRDAALALHKLVTVDLGRGSAMDECEACSNLTGHSIPWPCPTVRALRVETP
ncbi:hypothetical protein SAMN05444157_1602 [Frankineae bacterium MT45]|nr:hypothetical protein SAMN05444157_1602 [Frankineae bacterium MT45]